jgi:hypothetical protein
VPAAAVAKVHRDAPTISARARIFTAAILSTFLRGAASL